MTVTDNDPLVIALAALCEREGGYAKVAAAIGANDQSIYQIVSRRPSNKSGKPKSVGPKLRGLLAARYANWMDSQPSENATITAPALAAAIPVVLDALAAAPARAELRQLLPMLVDTDATAYRLRLAELLTQPTELHDSRPLGAPIAPEHDVRLRQMAEQAEELHAQRNTAVGPTQQRRRPTG